MGVRRRLLILRGMPIRYAEEVCGRVTMVVTMIANEMPTKGGQVRVATIHRYKGLESPVVVLCELDGRVGEEDLAGLLYVGATRARSHLVVVCSDAVRSRVAADRS